MASSGRQAIEDAKRSINRLGKWRTVFVGWQLGTRPIGDPECDALRDATDARLLMRAELSALAQLLVDRGVFTAEEFTLAVGHEADQLCATLRDRFPGFTETDTGMTLDGRAAETMKGWRP